MRVYAAMVLSAFACGRSSEIMSDVPPRGSAAAPGDAGGEAPSPGPVPALDLGPGFVPIGFMPGRYSVVVHRDMSGTHARNVVTDRSGASLVLDLAPDGSANACRGWSHDHQYDGPTVHKFQRFQLQQGFRGRHVLRDGEVHVELTADDTVCSEVREQDAPARAPAMTLRCVRATPRGHATLTEPVLLCDWHEAQSAELHAYTAEGVAPDRWVLLGGGNGIRIAVTGKPVSAAGDPLKVVVTPATERVEADAWQRPFRTESRLEP